MLGTIPTEDEDRPGASPVVLLPRDLWRRRFASDPDVLTRPLLVDGKPLAVVGVLPDGFAFPGDPELWTTFEDDGDVTTRANRYRTVVARLPSAVSPPQVSERLDSLCRRPGEIYPRSNRDWRASTAPWQEAQTTEARPQLLLLAVRAALGAGRSRIMSQLLIESLTLSLIGGVIGVGLAVWCVSLVAQFGPREIPRLAETAVNGRVLLFAAIASCVSAVLFA